MSERPGNTRSLLSSTGLLLLPEGTPGVHPALPCLTPRAAMGMLASSHHSLDPKDSQTSGNSTAWAQLEGMDSPGHLQ